ncbi:MAG: dihydrolipoamide acetyltransferase family protein [Deltaproteobacteria bacterium]|nr:dihydrolipoamide acetyltransferase family protein [Deltaproteobacteria bacterium]
MAYEFKLPDIGEGVVEGEIVKWLVGPGETVTEDQPLVEIMTDKASVEIPSPRAGSILSLEGAEGDVVAVGQTLLVIDVGDGEAPRARPEPAAKAAAPAAAPPEAPLASGLPDRAAPAAGGDTPPARLEGGLPARTTSPLAGRIQPSRRPAAATGAPVLASPAVRKQARDLGLDLSALQGSAPGGRITAGDLRGGASPVGSVTSAPKAPGFAPVPPGVAPPPPGGESRTPMKGVRRAIARAMQHSKNTAAHFTFVEEVDMRALVHMRDSLKGPAAERGAKLTYLPFFVKAATIALQKHPQLNCTLDEESGEIVYRGYYNIGMAAATDAGLMVPVIKNAEKLSLVEIALEIDRLAEAARKGKAKLDELQGSTFTITSLGAQGGLFATPVINFPEVAIMGIHQIKEKPIVDQGQIVPGKVMLLSLSFDHRLVDGHIGAAFAYEMVGLLEHPERLFLDAI